MNDEDESVLKRWSRRKAEAREGVAPDETLAEEEVSEQADETVDIETLPDPATLTTESDFTVFMRDGVPEDLRRMALRRLWRLDPVLANVDGLVDYGEDFTDAGTVIEGMKTAYRVGKGLLTDAEHVELKGVREEDAEEQAAAEEDMSDESEEEAAEKDDASDETAAAEPDDDAGENSDKV